MGQVDAAPPTPRTATHAPAVASATPEAPSGLAAFAGRHSSVVVATLAGASWLSSLTSSQADTPRARPSRSELEGPRATPIVEVAAPTRTARVLEDLSRSLERTMRVSARDLARAPALDLEHPSTRTPTDRELGGLLTDAVEQIPLAELPGGHALAAALEALPVARDLDVVNMSYRELTRALPKAVRAELDARFGDTIRRYKAPITALIAGGLVGARVASPEAAALIDRFAARHHLWDARTRSGAAKVTVDAVFRDRRVLPDLEVEGKLSRKLENGVELTATATASAALSPPAGGGAHPMKLSTNLGARTSTTTAKVGASIDEASRTKLNAELTWTKPLRDRGRIEAYAGASFDTKTKTPEYGAGVLVHFDW